MLNYLPVLYVVLIGLAGVGLSAYLISVVEGK